MNRVAERQHFVVPVEAAEQKSALMNRLCAWFFWHGQLQITETPFFTDLLVRAPKKKGFLVPNPRVAATREPGSN
jgi:hypothetical protein